MKILEVKMHCLVMGPKTHQWSSSLASEQKPTDMRFVKIVSQQLVAVVTVAEHTINEVALPERKGYFNSKNEQCQNTAGFI